MAAAFAIEQIPAFKVCGLRYTIAAFIIFLGLLVSGHLTKPSWLEIRNAIKAGIMFLGLGTGGAIWALNYIDTGLAALIIAGEPLIIVLMIWLIDKKVPARQTFYGIAMGILGMYLLVSQNEIITGKEQWLGISAILLSMLAWGCGTLMVNKLQLPSSQFLNSAIQMLSGGLCTLAISFAINEKGVGYEAYNSKTYLSMIFLIVFGSIVAFTAFNFLLKNVSPEKVVTNTYVNPIIALLLGYYFHDELITFQSLIAAVILICGVFIINTNKEKGIKKAS